MPRARLAADSAVAPVVGTLIFVVVAITGAAALYGAFSLLTPESVPPVTVGVVPRDAGTPTERTFMVSGASVDLHWERLSPTLDGRTLLYDGSLASAGTYCVLDAAATACLPDAAAVGDSLVLAGQHLRVHDAALAGRTFRLVDTGANAIVSEMVLR